MICSAELPVSVFGYRSSRLIDVEDSRLGELSKKKGSAAEKKAKSKNPLLNIMLMVVLGPAIIVSSVATRYFAGGLVGLALILWGMWETPEIHPYLKLVINWKTRSKTQPNRLKSSRVLTRRF